MSENNNALFKAYELVRAKGVGDIRLDKVIIAMKDGAVTLQDVVDRIATLEARLAVAVQSLANITALTWDNQRVYDMAHEALAKIKGDGK